MAYMEPWAAAKKNIYDNVEVPRAPVQQVPSQCPLVPNVTSVG